MAKSAWFVAKQPREPVAHARGKTTIHSSRQYLRDVIRPQHLFPGHPYRGADGVPYGVELDQLQQSDSVYSPFSAVAEDLGYTGDPTLEPSPFFTTLGGYRRQFNANVDDDAVS